MHDDTVDPHRYLRQAKSICEHHRNDPTPKKVERLRAHLARLQADGWSTYDCDRVEERARSLFLLPPRARDASE